MKRAQPVAAAAMPLLKRGSLLKKKPAASSPLPTASPAVEKAIADLRNFVLRHRSRSPPQAVPGQIRVFSDCAGVGTELLVLVMLGCGSNLVSVGGSESDPMKRAMLRRVHELCSLSFSSAAFAEDIMQRDPWKCPPADVYISGFPCPAFSSLGKKGRLEDKAGRGLPMFSCLRYICCQRPRLLLLENVKGFLSVKNQRAVHVLKAALEAMGYVSFYSVLDTREHGLPQSRQRMYWVAFHKFVSLKGNSFEFPDSIPMSNLKDFLQNSCSGQTVLNLPHYFAKVGKQKFFSGSAIE